MARPRQNQLPAIKDGDQSQDRCPKLAVPGSTPANTQIRMPTQPEAPGDRPADAPTNNSPAAAAAHPIGKPERIVSLDVVRGFATLGILIMNIQFFSMIGSAYLNPTAYGDLSNSNHWVWYLSHLFADMKFMSLFSMLFGAGIVLISKKRSTLALPTTGFHFRRMGWLLILGLLHAHLLWLGDILVPYALCGSAVFWFRNCTPRLLWTVGVSCFTIASLISIMTGLSMPFWPPEDILQLRQESWQPQADTIKQEIAANLQPYFQQLPTRSEQALFMETFLFVFSTMWRCSGLMLIGMALYKQRILTGERSGAVYSALIAIAVCIGIPATTYGIYRNFEADWEMSYSLFLGDQFNYWSSPLISLGYVGGIMLFLKSPILAKTAWPLARVGQMALSNYLLQTLLCTFLFYGHGFAQLGKFSRVEQLITVFVVSLVQIAFSCIWLNYFRFGPLEWLWRSLTYWHRQPLCLQT